MSKKKGGVGKTGGYILLGLLLLGLGGFGATNFGGSVSSIGKVGEAEIPASDYFRAIQQEMRAVQAQTGQALTFQQARAMGIPDMVLSRVVTSAALENEAAQLGISVGDERLAQDLREIPAFQGVDGSFDRESYRLALQGAGFSEREFEEQLRAESASTLLQNAIQAGVVLPPVYAQTLVSYTGERRAFTWAELGAEQLTTGLPVPTDEDLQTFYDENIDRYTRPTTRKITYAWLTPAMIVDTVEVPEDRLRATYEERSAEFNMPERRLVERLVYSSEEAAQEAAERVASGDVPFETLVIERGLDLADTDMGDVTEAALGDAGEAVFAADVGEVVQAPSDLGPALYRVNAVLAAQSTSFEEAVPQMRDTLALDQARRVIEGLANQLDDELAAGATLEDLAGNTEMELGQIDWTSSSNEGIAGYAAFNEAAAEAETGDYPAMAELGDGGLFALRLDEIQEAAPYPFEEVRDRVAQDWEANARATALADQAEALAGQLSGDTGFDDLNLRARTVDEGLTRNANTDDVPQAVLTQVFTMSEGEAAAVKGAGTAYVVRLDDIIEVDPEDENVRQFRQLFAQQADQDVSQDLFRALAQDIQSRAGVEIDQAAVNAVLANFQ
ncbi:peptidylprolyl isomerase [Sagittula sp. MA-2]|jgi:peptidyl-prolyl cis-trans isomerase D|uniref:peptidylprolyl isomerase n=1 Tax=Sagittula sp. MA-2 TaxID=3048007 RepID=UPI0024C23B48|nr:peptidylprolyl isomerase [Sagittula sp. MA-2]WHZ37254.1 SurA N-terminal domain-containing protein [Sagittula sp. MA-2]